MGLKELTIRNAAWTPTTEAGTPRKENAPLKLTDGAGLQLWVYKDGSKYWRWKYRFGGKEKLLSLGVYPEIRLAEARDKRDEARKLLKAGSDPSAVRQAQKRAVVIASANTLEALGAEWIENQRNRWTPDHAARVQASLEEEVYPDLGRRPIASITAPELLATLRKIESRGALETAQRVLQRCDGIFRYAVATGRAERSPAGDLRGALRAPKHKKMNALPASELPAFLRKLEAYDGHLQTKLALRLQVLTFVRPGELRAAEWTEFNVDEATWEIPAERMKMKLPHIVPLSRQALEALEQLRALTGRGRFCFPNQSNARLCMSENTVLFAIYRMGYHSRGPVAATGHGFRATASTILNEQGCWNPDAIERQLAHVERNKVRGAYNRAQYLDERRRMMQAWADYLDALAAGGKVTPMRKAA